MAAWNPRVSGNWANLFGFVAVSLFGKQRKSPVAGEHFVLLDGRLSSLTLSTGNAESIFESRCTINWAWSSNVPRSVVVDEKTGTIHAVRWDRPNDIRELRSNSPDDAKLFLGDLETPANINERTSIVQALDVFRSVREEIRDYGGSDLEATRAFTVLIRFADAMRRGNPSNAIRTISDIFNDPTMRANYRIDDGSFSNSAGMLPIRDLAKQLLGDGKDYSLDPYLLIRHASGTLFQEAHIAMADPVATGPKLFSMLGKNIPKPRGKQQRDAHYTPTPLARFLAERAIREFRRLNPKTQSIRILDPACGSGVFLVEALRELEGGGIPAFLKGVDTSNISKVMADFATEYARSDFVAAGDDVAISITTGDSLEVAWEQPDVILMNPPWIPWKRLSSIAKDQIKDSLGDLYHGQADMATAFLAKAVHAMKHGAVIATVIPASLLQSESLAKLRQILSGPEWRIAIIGRVRDYGYFRDATVEPAFIVVSKTPKSSIGTRTILAQSDAADRAIRESRITPGGESRRGEGWEIGICQSPDPSDWTPRPAGAKPLLNRMEKNNQVKKITDIFDVRLGIRTGDNPVFIMPLLAIMEMIPSERSLFRPISNTVRNGRIVDDRFVFYPYVNGSLSITTEEQLKGIAPFFYANRLLPNRQRLQERHSLRDRKWWELVEPRTTWLDFDFTRIVSMTFARRGAFAVDINGGHAVVQGQAWIWKGDRREVAEGIWFSYLAILNSPIFEAILDYFCPRTQGGQYEVSSRFLQDIPIPDLSLCGIRTKRIQEYGRAIHRGERVPLRSLNDAVAAAYGLPADELLLGFPLTDSSRREVEFESLASEWKRETAEDSSIAKKMEHSSFRRIIQMGDEAVVFILRDLKVRPAWWFGALQELTGADPVPAGKKGLLKESADAWISWARKNGYEL